MFFEGFFSDFDHTAFLVVASACFLMFLIWAAVHHYRYLFGHNHQKPPLHLGITDTRFEISLGKLRLAGFRRSAKLPIENITPRREADH